ncbi:MAG: hypothetical protein KAT88_09090, partial [Spirochaetes bacterium]|nr:hypothetical protein [Spirochaetota bacterium]
MSGGKAFAGSYYLLNDFYSIIYGRYYKAAFLAGPSEPALTNLTLPQTLSLPDSGTDSIPMRKMSKVFDEEELTTELTLEGEISLNLRYGEDFSLKSGTVPGAGSAGITQGLEYTLIERILLEGNIGERFYV